MHYDSDLASDLHRESDILIVLNRVAHLTGLFAKDYFSRYGLTLPHAIALNFIGKNKGCNQRAIEQHTELKSASITVLLGNLESKGLIERARNPLDARGVIVSLTPKGRRALKAAHSVMAEINAIVTQSIPPAELARLRGLLLTMLQNISRTGEAEACLAKKNARSSRRRKADVVNS